MKMFYLIMAVVLATAIVSAQTSYDNCEVYGNCQKPTTSVTFNNITGGVNNSNCWQGFCTPALFDLTTQVRGGVGNFSQVRVRAGGTLYTDFISAMQNPTKTLDMLTNPNTWTLNNGFSATSLVSQYLYSATLGSRLTTSDTGWSLDKGFTITGSNQLQAPTITDSILTITSGAITGGVSATFSGLGNFGTINARNVCYSNGTGCNSSLSASNFTNVAWLNNTETFTGNITLNPINNATLILNKTNIIINYGGRGAEFTNPFAYVTSAGATAFYVNAFGGIFGNDVSGFGCFDGAYQYKACNGGTNERQVFGLKGTGYLGIGQSVDYFNIQDFWSHNITRITFDGNLTTNGSIYSTGKFNNLTGDLWIGNSLTVAGNFSAKRAVWYGYFNTTQTFLNTANAQIVNISNNADRKEYQISLENQQNFTFQTTGEYILAFSPEFFQSTGGSALATFYLQKTNDAGTTFRDVDWSNQRYTLPNGFYSAPTIEFPFEINDTREKIRVMWWSDSANTQLYSSGALTSPTRPSIPAVLVNIRKSSALVT